MPNPKTFKLVLKGEVVEVTGHVELDNGEIIEKDKIRKILVPSKKNQQQITLREYEKINDQGETTIGIKPVLIASKQHQKWYAEHTEVFLKWRDKMIISRTLLPIERAKVTILFYFPDGRVRDLGNKAETLYDIMQETGIIQNDGFKVFSPILLDGWTDRSNPRTEIYLTLITPDMKEFAWDKTPASYYEKAKARKSKLQKQRRLIRRQTNNQ